MRRESHVRFCERLGGRSPGPTRLVIGFRNKADAYRVWRAMERRLARFRLRLHPDKTRLIRFDPPGRGDRRKAATFDFLGFTHYWGRSRRGRPVVRQKTARDRVRRTLKRANQWCRRHRHWPVAEQYRYLVRALKGHYAYFGVTGNIAALKRVRLQIARIWIKWLNRRSQRRMSWDTAQRLLARYPLPPPRIVHSAVVAR